MRTHKSYRSYLLESLADPAEAAAYLNAAFEDGDRELIIKALKDVTEARPLRSQGSDSKYDWLEVLNVMDESTYSELSVVSELLSKLGLRLSVSTKDEQMVDAA